MTDETHDEAFLETYKELRAVMMTDHTDPRVRELHEVREIAASLRARRSDALDHDSARAGLVTLIARIDGDKPDTLRGKPIAYLHARANEVLIKRDLQLRNEISDAALDRAQREHSDGARSVAAHRIALHRMRSLGPAIFAAQRADTEGAAFQTMQRNLDGKGKKS